jgi:hypothetical protein
MVGRNEEVHDFARGVDERVDIFGAILGRMTHELDGLSTEVGDRGGEAGGTRADGDRHVVRGAVSGVSRWTSGSTTESERRSRSVTW